MLSVRFAVRVSTRYSLTRVVSLQAKVALVGDESDDGFEFEVRAR